MSSEHGKQKYPFPHHTLFQLNTGAKIFLKLLNSMQLCKKNSTIFPPPSNSTLSNQNCYGFNYLQTRKTAFKFRDNGIYKSLIQKVIFCYNFFSLNSTINTSQLLNRYLKTHHAFLSLCDSLRFVTRWGLQMNASRVRSLQG